MANRPYAGTFDRSDLGKHPSRQALVELQGRLLAYTRGEAIPEQPLLARRVAGEKQPSDAVWMGTMLAASSAFLAALAPFSGWSAFPVVVFDGWGQSVPGYAGIAVTGRCGVMRPILDRVEREGVDAKYIGTYFDLATWDGSDLFYPTHGWGLIVTARVRAALTRARIRNLRFERLDEICGSKVSIDRMRELVEGPFAAVPPNPPR